MACAFNGHEPFHFAFFIMNKACSRPEPASFRLSTLSGTGMWFLFMAFTLLDLNSAEVRETGSTVAVVYNKQMAESKAVADHYAKARAVPASQVIGLDLPTTETMTRKDFIEQLEQPLHKAFLDGKMFVAGDRGPGRPPLSQASIRYLALCFGVPLKVENDPDLKEPGMEKMPDGMRRSGCAVDAQLALLPWAGKAPWLGIVPNPGYGVTNDMFLHPTNGFLLVSRLDGPTAAIAKGLVDKAIEAETNGLWGRAYFDARGITNGPYAQGDSWISRSAFLAQAAGLETVLDEQEAVFGLDYPMSHIAFYAGWYSQDVWGPFILPKVEFMPGAFGYHLHSFSAQSLRDPSTRWVAPLLAKGVTITMGCVDEPFLAGTPDVHAFLGRLIAFRTSFGEAAYACQEFLSWQTTVVGDPLYTPFWRQTAEAEQDLMARTNSLAAWANLMEANQNIVRGADKNRALRFLQQSANRHHPVILEKSGDMLMEQKRYNLAAETYEDVLKRSDSPMQRLRVLFSLGEARSLYGPDQKAFEAYQSILRDYPDYHGRKKVYENIIPIARRLGKRDDEQRLTRELNALPPQPTPATFK